MDEELGETEQADVAALADGSLAPGRRRAVEARVAASPSLQAALAEQRAALDAVQAADDDRAPDELRAWLRDQDEQAPHPVAPRRPRARVAAVAAVAAAVTAVVVSLALVPALTGSDDVEDLARAAARPPAGPAPGRAPGDDLLLTASADGIAFPDWEPRLGWRATGVRADEVAGRRAVTVRYARDGRSFAYAILGRPAADLPGGTGRYRALVHEGRPAVAWIRAGRTCLLLAGRGVDRADLRRLAASTRFY